ncbi:MAG: tetraacyldisaccharide 4'-kinase [Rhodospirillales bacterium]
MQAPDFWRKPPGLWARLLSPLGLVYGRITDSRSARQPDYKSTVPVICVGNIVMGGAGKTPVVQSLASSLGPRRPHILTRGYGGREAGPLLVDPQRHSARDVGDEALLHARTAPTWVARDRVAGCKAAEAAGAGLILMDDGFQNPSLHKTLRLLVIDSDYGFGNGMAFPAGPLRGGIQPSLDQSDAVILTGSTTMHLTGYEKPVFRARLTPDNAMAFRGISVVAFSGIGRPEKFFRTLTEAGAGIRARRAFADHHPFTRAEIEHLITTARTEKAVLVTTEKDFVRIPPDLRPDVQVLTVRLLWENNGNPLDMIAQANV